ncbi:MAG: glycosyltransferase family 39 protein, partial [Chloroflexi bacterium]|nr:glycosyltransferase family 39 protein [Chloroflexota bacterium]
KPTHALLIGLADGVLGVHDYATLLLDASFSILGVALTYLIARRVFGARVGPLSALLLAVSQYDVIYARSGLSESDANAFFLAGVFAWLLSRPPAGRPRAQPAAAVLLGLAFTTNYRIVVYAGTLVLVDLLGVRGFRASRWRWLGQRALVWLAGMLAAPLLWQGVDLVARARGLVLFRSEITGKPMWYLQQARYQLREGRQAALHFDPGSYLHWYVLREGWPVALLVLAGLALVVLPRGPGLRGRNEGDGESPSVCRLTPAALVIVPYLVYVFAPFIVPRNLDATVPFACVLAALALTELTDLLRPRPLALGSWLAVAAALAILGVAMSWPLGDIRSGYARAAGYVTRDGAPPALVTNEIMVFYLEGARAPCRTLRLPQLPSQLAAPARAGYRYAVVDQFNRAAARYLRAHLRAVRRYPLLGPASLGENIVRSETPRRSDPNDPYTHVDVYRLDPALLPPGRPDHLPVCSRDKV